MTPNDGLKIAAAESHSCKNYAMEAIPAGAATPVALCRRAAVGQPRLEGVRGKWP